MILKAAMRKGINEEHRLLHAFPGLFDFLSAKKPHRKLRNPSPNTLSGNFNPTGGLVVSILSLFVEPNVSGEQA